MGGVYQRKYGEMWCKGPCRPNCLRRASRPRHSHSGIRPSPRSARQLSAEAPSGTGTPPSTATYTFGDCLRRLKEGWRGGVGAVGVVGGAQIVLGVGLHPVARVFSHPCAGHRWLLSFSIWGVRNRRLFSLPPSLQPHSGPPFRCTPRNVRTARPTVQLRSLLSRVGECSGQRLDLLSRPSGVPNTPRPTYSCDRGVVRTERGRPQPGIEPEWAGRSQMLLPPLKGRVRLTVMEACSRYGRRHWCLHAAVRERGDRLSAVAVLLRRRRAARAKSCENVFSSE